MKKGFYNILKANFLISEDAYKNWRFIVFCTILAIVMIASSHSAEKKVHEIARLNDEVRELRSEFVERRSDLMKIKMESTITEKMVEKGIGPSDTPPNKIRVIIKD
ncbi:FtsL-like putative cell division protein [Gramella sp. GC03-9]|uniref:FtsL-like putative cell division protein n=1 Tax=Christiangramia oceanisediminis TaxID=2920386 RepID=A0A9X2RDT8_9FLAO|nr:FtsL-like putative cell division protein [Gramella oceanisediminis]MCP9201475.1 FtsL-like putative cell division protein [Gramella oceanisediminis]